MFSWLKKKINIWKSEQIARLYQELHTKKLQDMSQNIPKELKGINSVETTLNSNSWAVHHLFKKSRANGQYAEAFLYFLYSLELFLKHLIVSEMELQNMLTIISNFKNNPGYFTKYSENKFFEILEGKFTAGALIKEFLRIFPNFVHKQDLWDINNERKHIIHNMLKKEMSETEIQESFHNFFNKTDSGTNNVLSEFADILAKRQENLFKNLKTYVG